MDPQEILAWIARTQAAQQAAGEPQQVAQAGPEPVQGGPAQDMQQGMNQPGGLNPQGYGAAGIPLSPARPPALMQGSQAGLGRNWMPQGGPPDQNYMVQANPLTGILENVPMPLQPGQRDARRLWQVQQLEQAMDQVQQHEGLSDQQKQFASNKINNRLNAIDPTQQYRRNSLAQQMTPMERYVSQMMHIDKEHGFVMALDGKGTPHFHKLEDNMLELRKQHEEHQQKIQQMNQERLQDHEKHIQERVAGEDQRRRDFEAHQMEMKKMAMEMRQMQIQFGQQLATKQEERKQAHDDSVLQRHTAHDTRWDKAVSQADTALAARPDFKDPTKRSYDAIVKEINRINPDLANEHREFNNAKRRQASSLNGTSSPSANGHAPMTAQDFVNHITQDITP